MPAAQQLHPQTPGPLSPLSSDERPIVSQYTRRTNEFAKNHAIRNEFSNSVGIDRTESSLMPFEVDDHRRLSDLDATMQRQHADAAIKTHQPSKKRTLVVYSGPTSLDPTVGKNGVYLRNFDYFIENGIECDGLGGVDPSQPRPDQRLQENNIQYVIVLTQEVADQYTALDGLITRKQAECRLAEQNRQRSSTDGSSQDQPLITVLTREDRCYDMESLLVVLRTFDVPHLYDQMVYMNCGLAGPKFGPGSPPHWEGLSSWTELYTSLLSEKVQMVGHTINTHFNTVYSPHIQSFLFAVNTKMVDIWLQTGVIYECGISNEDFKDDILRMALVWRYEVGISRVLLERGYSIAAAFMHQSGRIGDPLVIDSNSTFGRNLAMEDVIHSDVFTEDGLRRLTESSFVEYQDRRKYAILPWDCYVFFKVSRLIPYDIQDLMQYENVGPLQLVPNDARHSSIFAWRRKAGLSLFGEGLRLVGLSRIGNRESLRCRGRICKFEKVTEEFGVFMIVAMMLWYFATLKFVERRLSLHRLSELRRKWK
eukprot:CCRYP_016342-RA/>CCRYP_016342-RA protein AED:0.01 eAED:0.00 QI:0/-1/0/1/-1/1/1/0/536